MRCLKIAFGVLYCAISICLSWELIASAVQHTVMPNEPVVIHIGVLVGTGYVLFSVWRFLVTGK